MKFLLKIWKAIDGWKTYLGCAAMIIYAVVVIGWQGGDWSAAGRMVLEAMTAAGFRHAL